jgi:hypothetical protein
MSPMPTQQMSTNMLLYTIWSAQTTYTEIKLMYLDKIFMLPTPV